MAEKPPLVDQPSRAPMRKVTAAALWGAAGTAAAGVAVRVVEARYPIISGPDVNAFILLAVPAAFVAAPAAVTGAVAFVAGYFTRNRATGEGR